MLTRSFAAALIGASLVVPSLAAADDSKAKQSFTPGQEEAIRKLVKDYLIKNPEVLVEAMQKLREKQQAAERQRLKRALVALRSDIYENPESPVAGNPKGDVTIVEFFDYQCGYCKSVVDRLLKTVKDDGNVRLVFKEFPILGAQSVFAAKAALAARKQGKYNEFHEALMRLKGGINHDSVFAVAKSVGIDTKQLAKDMTDPALDKVIQKNFAIARALRINGTPAFIIGDQLVPGAVNEQNLKAFIERARKSG